MANAPLNLKKRRVRRNHKIAIFNKTVKKELSNRKLVSVEKQINLLCEDNATPIKKKISKEVTSPLKEYYSESETEQDTILEGVGNNDAEDDSLLNGMSQVSASIATIDSSNRKRSLKGT
jgi:hypothetical protein